MYHPILVEYCKKALYTTPLYSHAPKGVKEKMRVSLWNCRHIVDLSWRHLKDLGFPGGGDVYEFGWQWSDDTRKLKKLFEEIVSFEGFDHKKLEDYL